MSIIEISRETVFVMKPLEINTALPTPWFCFEALSRDQPSSSYFWSMKTMI